MRSFCLSIIFGFIISPLLKAQITIPQILGNDMVLQNGVPVPVWGHGIAGEKVTVTFAGQVKSAVVDASGEWKVVLSKLKIAATPKDLVIKGSRSSNAIVLHNILVGEVWLSSGQSNMEYTMRRSSKEKVAYDTIEYAHAPMDELNHAHNNEIRIFKVVNHKQLLQRHPLHDGWSIAQDSALRSFSAVSYFFAKELYARLHVPIGIISSAIPGSAIEPWFAGELTDSPYVNHPAVFDLSKPGKFYSSMIEPLAPFAIKGFLWYQGETNCFQNESIGYAYKMKALIDQWRRLWDNNKLPFYYTQIAPFYYSKSKGKYPLDKETLPKFWEAQSVAKKIPYTGMIVTTDLPDNLDNIHPPRKWKDGYRLALIALGRDYGKKIIYNSPEYNYSSADGNKLIIHFKKQDGKLVSKDGKPLTYFEVAGEDGKFYKADAAIISNDEISLSSPQVKKPVNARFAWNEAAQPNLFNNAGLPAEPFRTNNPYTDIKL